MSNLYAIHDFSPEWAGLLPPAGVTGWAIITEEIGHDPNNFSGADYSHLANYGLTPIVRLNNGYGSAGTIPLPEAYQAFAQRCANFVRASTGSQHWIIGNEPNLAGERPGGVAIMAHQYADCFRRCRNAIKNADLIADVMPAPVAPYNIDTGWCMEYWWEMLAIIAGSAQDGGADGLAIHTYSRGPNPASIVSNDKMAPPYQSFYNGFRAYRDFLSQVPAVMRALPVYITETDQNDPWADINNGWVKNAYTEIDIWNSEPGSQTIHCLALYRWPNYDQWGFCEKQGVIDDFREALAYGYGTPGAFEPEPIEPPTEAPTEPGAVYPEYWDGRLDQRGCELDQAVVEAGEPVRRVAVGRWFDEREAGGRTNMYVRLVDADGNLAVGVPITQFWSTGSNTRPSEIKSDPWLQSMGLPAEYSLDFPMYTTAPAYGLTIEQDGIAGDVIRGCGLGSIEAPAYNIHTAYYFEITLVTASAPVIPPFPIPTPEAKLIWPLAGAITQQFGQPPAQFGQAGHDGIDIAAPLGAPVLCIAAGVVMYAGDDPNYGLYVRVYHADIQSHSFYAHLDGIFCRPGDHLEQGEIVGAVGVTGNTTGPHLHFELRAGSEGAYFEGVTWGYTQGRYNPVCAYVATGSQITPGAGI